MSNPIEIATELDARLRHFEKLHGSKWPILVRDMEPMIRTAMKKMDTTNPLVVATSIGKQMTEEGKDPNFLIAVCAALAIEQKQP